ncbi:MAG: NADH-quinone oxidoreductase subunit C [Chloroflexi bacterium]|nr:NADH-quinone oxidoreductase subunit C [Chloroflexota bacterium]
MHAKLAISEIVEQLKTSFSDHVDEVVEFRGDTTVVVKAEGLIDVLTQLRHGDGMKFNLLSDLSAIDYYPNEPRFHVIYTLFSIAYNQGLRIKALTGDDNPHLPTVTSIWPSADYAEREVFDLFGVVFDGHPDPRRILMPHDWTGHPLRKDYPLGYEEVQFSFNYERVQSQKPHPKE